MICLPVALHGQHGFPMTAVDHGRIRHEHLCPKKRIVYASARRQEGWRSVSDLVSRTTRGLFRDLMTGSTVGAIGAAFQDELFAPNPDSTYQDSSVRRVTTQENLEAIDWTDINQVSRALRVFERLIQGFEPQ